MTHPMSTPHCVQGTTGAFGRHSLWYGAPSLSENLLVGNGRWHAVHVKQSGWYVCPVTRSRGPNLSPHQYTHTTYAVTVSNSAYR